MKYFVEVNGREHEVELVERLGELLVAVDSKALELDYCEVDDQGQVSLLCGQDSYAVSIESASQNEFSITIAGHLYEVAIEDERERAAHAAERESASRGGVLKSVMSGVVVELLVEQGSAVEVGQPLLILEAMKMQNEISAEFAGRVEALHVAAGDAVGSGAKLITIVVADPETKPSKD